MARRIEKLRDQDTAELSARQNELAEQVFRLRFQLSTGQAEAVTKLRSARKDLARVKTLLRERELKNQHGNSNNGCARAPQAAGTDRRGY